MGETAEISATVKDLKGAGGLFICPLNSPVQPVQTLTESWRMTVNHKLKTGTNSNYSLVSKYDSNKETLALELGIQLLT